MRKNCFQETFQKCCKTNDQNSQIDYRIFLHSVMEYRKTTENPSTLQCFKKSLFYTEEFTFGSSWPWIIPLLIAIQTISLISQLNFFNQEGIQITWDGPVPKCSYLIYDPFRRFEPWRFFTYLFVNIGILHYLMNIILQIFVGVFLELQQDFWMKGALSIPVIFFTGTIAGSLGTSMVDPDTYLAGTQRARKF